MEKIEKLAESIVKNYNLLLEKKKDLSEKSKGIRGINDVETRDSRDANDLLQLFSESSKIEKEIHSLEANIQSDISVFNNLLQQIKTEKIRVIDSKNTDAASYYSISKNGVFQVKRIQHREVIEEYSIKI